MKQELMNVLRCAKETCLKAYNDQELVLNYDNIIEEKTKGIFIECENTIPNAHKTLRFSKYYESVLNEYPGSLDYTLSSLFSVVHIFSLFKYKWDKKKRRIYMFKKSMLYELNEKKITSESLSLKEEGKLIQTIFKEKNIRNRIRDVNQSLRYRIFRRDYFTCVKCGIRGQRNGGEAILHIDHIIPISCGGSNEEKNLQTLCKGCNLKKSDVT